MNRHILSMIIFVIMAWIRIVSADEKNPEQTSTVLSEIVRAKIGINLCSGEDCRLSKAYEQVRTGDRFKIYAVPEPESGYVYVIYADQETVKRLNVPEQTVIPKDHVLIFPSPDKFYEFHQDQRVSLVVTIICSATKVAELEGLFLSQECQSADWVKLEQKLIEQSRIDISTLPEKPWQIAGTTRDIFIGKLKISSGKGMVIKKYEFRIQK